jgi:uncharacterized protein YdaU (DUF1376 family)
MAKDKSPALQWYPRDILSSARVAALTDAEELWYRRALDFCWLNVTLPADPETFARIVGRGCTVDGARAVLALFTPVKNDATKVQHDRQQKERLKQKKNRKQKSVAGKASAEKRRKQRELAAQTAVRSAATAVEIPLQRNSTLHLQSSSSSSEEKKEETHTDAGVSFTYPLKDLVDAFPFLADQTERLNIPMLELEVKDNAVDRAAWAETIKIYRMNYNRATNTYCPEKLGNVLSVFKKERQRIERDKNGKSQRNTSKSAEWNDTVEEYGELFDSYTDVSEGPDDPAH